MDKKDKYIQIGMTVAFAVIVWCFWSLRYPQALAFQEQWQLFLFDKEFLMEHLAVPGGVARYIGEFIVQFYNKVILGGALIALLFVALQLSTWWLAKPMCKSKLVAYAVSFLPVWQLWFYMGDEKVKLTFTIALLFAEIAMMCCPKKESTIAKVVYIALVIPLLAWIAGPTVLVFGLYIALRDNIHKPFSWISILAFFYAIVCILVSGRLTIIPLSRLFYGVNYSIVIDEMPTMQYTVMALFAIVPVLMSFIPDFKKQKTSYITTVAVLAAYIVLSVVTFPNSYKISTYDVMNYDAMVRAQQWDKVIAAAEKNTPNTPLTVALLNLALANKGQLNERGFDFFQNGWAGAFPQFTKEYESSLIIAELYFYTGLINSAQRLDFEAQEALPDHAKSVRCVKRLAETNLINGQYTVARRYLQILQKTMFYSGWATRTMAMLGNEKAINAHPLYGHLRKLHLKNDFIFSDVEIDKIMGQLLMANPDNTLAMQYLLFLPQLEGNQQKYAAYSNFLRSLLEKTNK